MDTKTILKHLRSELNDHRQFVDWLTQRASETNDESLLHALAVWCEGRYRAD